MPLLVLLFIIVPILELWVIIQVGQAIGALPTIIILIADSLAGALLLRHQGRAAWTAFTRAIGGGRLPARETADGALVILGGALLLTPGFCTDIFGLLLLIAPTRAVMRRFLFKRFVVVGTGGLGPAAQWSARGARWGASRAGRATRTGNDFDVEGTATEVGDERPDRPALP